VNPDQTERPDVRNTVNRFIYIRDISPETSKLISALGRLIDEKDSDNAYAAWLVVQLRWAEADLDNNDALMRTSQYLNISGVDAIDKEAGVALSCALLADLAGEVATEDEKEHLSFAWSQIAPFLDPIGKDTTFELVLRGMLPGWKGDLKGLLEAVEDSTHTMTGPTRSIKLTTGEAPGKSGTTKTPTR
jgi:hypothetical protein